VHTVSRPLRPPHPARLRARAAVLVGVVVAVLSAACGGPGPGPGGNPDAGTGTTVVDTTAVPAQPRWEPYRGVAVPYSSDGPTTLDALAPTGYVHTPQGAVVAAMQAQVRLALAPDIAWATVSARLLAPGPGRDAYAITRVMASVTAEADPATTAHYAGFRITDYRDTTAVVWLATRMPDRTLSASPSRMVWLAGDWKLALPDPNGADSSTGDQAIATAPVPLDTLDGYTVLTPATEGQR